MRCGSRVRRPCPHLPRASKFKPSPPSSVLLSQTTAAASFRETVDEQSRPSRPVAEPQARRLWSAVLRQDPQLLQRELHSLCRRRLGCCGRKQQSQGGFHQGAAWTTRLLTKRCFQRCTVIQLIAYAQLATRACATTCQYEQGLQSTSEH